LYTLVSHFLHKFLYHMSQMPNSLAKIFIFVCLLFTFNQALAGQAAVLYDVEVLVVDESADTRWRVFKEGLDEVFIRIAGDSIVMDKLKRPAASRFIKQYSYDPVSDPQANEEGELLSYRLKIQYNGSAMEKYLHDNGFPVWGGHRTEVVVWLAIRDGRNEYVLKDTDQSLLKTSADEALHRRGIPGRWPLYDYKDRKILNFADIRGGFKDPVVTASRRYSRGPSLTGSLIWNGSLWQSSWSLLMESGNRHWSIEDADYNQLINKAVDQAVDAMGIVYAIHGVGKNQKLATVQLDVQAVNTVKKYRKLENYLRELNSVETAIPVQVDGQSAIFEVVLRSSEEEFLNLIKNDAELVEAEPVKPQLEIEEQPLSKLQEGLPAEAKDAATGTEKPADALAAAGSNETGSLIDESQSLETETLPDTQEPQTPVYYYRLIK